MKSVKVIYNFAQKFFDVIYFGLLCITSSRQNNVVLIC